MRSVAIALLTASMLYSQVTTGSIRGTVSDTSSAVVPGAKVTLTNVRTGVQVAATTDALGNYLFDFLPASLYRVELESAGFKKFTQDNISLEMAPPASRRHSP
jgi:hypothetical protein